MSGRKKTDEVGAALAIIAVIIIAIAAAVYFDPVPKLSEPKCAVSEVAMFKDGWWCVQARKP